MITKTKNIISYAIYNQYEQLHNDKGPAQVDGEGFDFYLFDVEYESDLQDCEDEYERYYTNIAWQTDSILFRELIFVDYGCEYEDMLYTPHYEIRHSKVMFV